MSTPTLADLMTSSTPQEVLALELQIASGLGLPTTAWQPVQAIPTLFNINATIVADYSTTVAYLAQGGYASLAALMVDSNGNPVTTWMDLRGVDQYGLGRILASYASGPVPLQNTSGVAYPYSPNNPLHASNPVTGATYTSSGTGSVAASATTTVQFQADITGSASTTGAGVTLVLTTPLNGVSVLALTSSIVGTDSETNAAYLLRCQGKIANISPNGPSQAYYYVATSIPQGTPSASPPYAVSAIITRCTVFTNPGTGIVNVIVANSAGGPSAPDVAAVTAAIQNQVVPLSVACSVSGATNTSVSVAYTVFVPKSLALTPLQITTAIADALALLFAAIPIGGYNLGTPGATNVLPLSLVSEAIMGANPGTVDCLVSLNGTLADFVLGATAVPVETIVSTTVLYV
jgi:hypothetical protein